MFRMLQVMRTAVADYTIGKALFLSEPSELSPVPRHAFVGFQDQDFFTFPGEDISGC